MKNEINKNQGSKTQGTGNNKTALWIMSVVSVTLLAVFAVVSINRAEKFKEQHPDWIFVLPLERSK